MGTQIMIQHDGEYVLTTAGSRDFGEISADTGLPPGKIRLRKGKQDGVKGDYGEKHIERPERLAQLKQNGFNSARDLVEYVAGGYEAIYPGEGRAYILTREYDSRENSTVYVELKPSGEGDFYDTTGGLIANKRHVRKKKPLWVRPDSGSTASKDGAVDAPSLRIADDPHVPRTSGASSS